MSDITMCCDVDCKLKESCYRYTAWANPYRQAYFINSPREGDECTMFWSNEGYKCHKTKEAIEGLEKRLKEKHDEQSN